MYIIEKDRLVVSSDRIGGTEKQNLSLQEDDTMASTVTTSKMSDGQIENVVSKLRDALRKSRNEFESGPVQQALGIDNLGQVMLEPFRKQVEAVSEMIVRPFKVDRIKTPEQMIKALCRNEYVSDDVLETMPTEGPSEGELYFFPIKRFISVKDLALEFESRGLIPDPYAQLQVNIDDPSFADEHPNGVQWQDAKGRYCFVACDGWGGGRLVGVDTDDYVWNVNWWFAGRRK